MDCHLVSPSSTAALDAFISCHGLDARAAGRLRLLSPAALEQVMAIDLACCDNASARIVVACSYAQGKRARPRCTDAAHAAPSAPAVPHSGPAPFTCDLCGQGFGSRNALFKHLRSSCDRHDGSGPAVGAPSPAASEVPPPPSIPPPSSALNSGAARGGAHDLGRRSESDGRGHKGTLPLPLTEEERARELWVGGLTSRAATTKGIAQLLWQATHVGWNMPAPHVRMVKRRGYKVDGQWLD